MCKICKAGTKYNDRKKYSFLQQTGNKLSVHYSNIGDNPIDPYRNREAISPSPHDIPRTA